MANNSNGEFPWFGFIIVLAIVLAVIGNLTGRNNSGSTVSTPTVDRGTFEHRYATERFKQEGYSTSESQQAADAVIKFMQAQEARKR